jgi:hypothetical protein
MMETDGSAHIGRASQHDDLFHVPRAVPPVGGARDDGKTFTETTDGFGHENCHGQQ